MLHCYFCRIFDLPHGPAQHRGERRGARVGRRPRPSGAPVSIGAVDAAQIERERRAGLPAAMAALGAMLLPVLAVSLPRMVVEGDLETARQTLLAMGRAPGVFLAAGGIQAVGTALVAVVLHYLYRATRARRPETPAIAGVLAIVMTGSGKL